MGGKTLFTLNFELNFELATGNWKLFFTTAPSPYTTPPSAEVRLRDPRVG